MVEANNPTLRQIIRKWIDDKGIIPKGKISKDSLAFLISRKIHKEGIKPTRTRSRLIVDAINENELNKLFNILGDDFKTSLINFMKNGNN
jgi:hypothetical protein